MIMEGVGAWPNNYTNLTLISYIFIDALELSTLAFGQGLFILAGQDPEKGGVRE